MKKCVKWTKSIWEIVGSREVGIGGPIKLRADW